MILLLFAQLLDLVLDLSLAVFEKLVDLFLLALYLMLVLLKLEVDLCIGLASDHGVAGLPHLEVLTHLELDAFLCSDSGQPVQGSYHSITVMNGR